MTNDYGHFWKGYPHVENDDTSKTGWGASISESRPTYSDDDDRIHRHRRVDSDSEGEGISAAALAEMLEHDAALSLEELVDGTYEDIVERTELEFNFGPGADAAFHKVPLPEHVPTLAGLNMTTQVTYNFGRWVARDELKRFAGRLDSHLKTKYFIRFDGVLARQEQENKKLKYRLEATQAFLGVLLFLLLVCFAVVLRGR